MVAPSTNFKLRQGRDHLVVYPKYHATPPHIILFTQSIMLTQPLMNNQIFLIKNLEFSTFGLTHPTTLVIAKNPILVYGFKITTHINPIWCWVFHKNGTKCILESYSFFWKMVFFYPPTQNHIEL